MPQKKDVLYPPGYNEPKPTTAGTDAPGRSKAGVIAILRDATKDEELSLQQLLMLVCGHTVPKGVGVAGGKHYDVTVPEERDAAIAAVKQGKNVRGPDCAKSFNAQQVVAIIREEIANAEKTWTFQGDQGEDEE
jgi:hypothetical protein